MDTLVALIVRFISACVGWACALPSAQCMRHVPGERLKVLLVGYNGARNTGSDVRVAALADQLIELLGAENVEISVMSLDTQSTAPYFEGKARQIPFNTVFFSKLLKACLENHVAVLCEGSTFKSMFADALTLYSCEAAGVMRAQGKPCIAYGGEVGAMSPMLESTVRFLCSDVLFMARSRRSYEAALSLGLEARHGTDTAWTFDSSRGRDEAMALLRSGGWDGERPLLGIAPVNPFWWPVRPSLVKWLAYALGSKRFIQFQKWYFFSWDEQRKARFERYLDDMAAASYAFAEEHGYQPVLFGMERLDEDACLKMADRLGSGTPVLLSKNLDGHVIGEALRSLGLLLTSRYHAQVLAAGTNVPAVGVTIDERIANLDEEFGLPSEMLLGVDDENLAVSVLGALEYAHENRDALGEAIAEGRAAMTARLDDMSAWFTERLAAYGICAGDSARIARPSFTGGVTAPAPG